MNPNRPFKVIKRTLVGICSATMLLSSSCGVEQLRAVVAGVDAAANQLDRNHNDDITFGEWLVNEFDD